jgi:hypothetical protein
MRNKSFSCATRLAVLIDGLVLGGKQEMTENFHDYGYRAPRLPVGFGLLLQTQNANRPVLNGLCTDLSEDGLAVDTGGLLDIGEQVTLIMTLPGTATSVRLAASVTNSRAGGYGLSFIFSSPRERSFMQEYLESQLKRS